MVKIRTNMNKEELKEYVKKWLFTDIECSYCGRDLFISGCDEILQSDGVILCDSCLEGIKEGRF